MYFISICNLLRLIIIATKLEWKNLLSWWIIEREKITMDHSAIRVGLMLYCRAAQLCIHASWLFNCRNGICSLPRTVNWNSLHVAHFTLNKLTSSQQWDFDHNSVSVIRVLSCSVSIKRGVSEIKRIIRNYHCWVWK